MKPWSIEYWDDRAQDWDEGGRAAWADARQELVAYAEWQRRYVSTFLECLRMAYPQAFPLGRGAADPDLGD